MMYHQSNKSNQLLSTPPLSNYENEYLLFNFRFILSIKKLDAIHYKKVFNKLINNYSNWTVKEFTKNTKIEFNDNIINIINRNNSKNERFINYLKEKYKTEFKSTYDIYRENKGMRAYGFLNKNILSCFRNRSKTW